MTTTEAIARLRRCGRLVTVTHADGAILQCDIVTANWLLEYLPPKDAFTQDMCTQVAAVEAAAGRTST